MADNCVRIFVALELARLGDAQKQSAWHLVTLLVVVPAVVFAPLNGAICNSFPKPRVLVGSSLLPAIFLIGTSAIPSDLGLLVGWALISLTSAINGPVRYAFLPAAAQDTRWPLTRINGLFEMGSAAAIIAGLSLGVHLSQQPGTPLEFMVALYAVSLVASCFVAFPSDLRRSESPYRAIAGFFADGRRIWNIKETCGCLLGLASLRGLLTGLMGALIINSLDDNAFLTRLLGIGAWVMVGVGAGSFLAGLQRHPRRVLGLVPLGATGLSIGLAITTLGVVPHAALCFTLGVMVGLVNVPLAATYQAVLPADARGNGMAVRNFADYLVTALVAGMLFALGRWAGWSATAQLWLIAALAGVLTVLSWRVLIGPVFEQFLEIVIWPIYRIKGYGPGLYTMPTQGPVLVVANHTAWMDPVWVGKVLPRRLVGMLTSVFFDIPALRFVVTRLAETIRVEQSSFRREVPELKKAIAILDRGDCVLIFPEGGLRKKEENLLKQFGQGVWHILNERPLVPVVACWVDGGWGCFFSYFKGPPTKNKLFDFWRRIRVGVSAPAVIPTGILADHRTARRYLMQMCLESRHYLGLEVPTLEKMREEEENLEKSEK
jgi:1-acyl-sn-glycerol-3-phosphate acyltransferase